MALRLASLVALLFLGLCDASFAQWTVAAYGGSIHTQSADLRVARPAAGLDLTFPDTAFRSESFDPPLYYGYRVGRSIYRHKLFIEGELIHAKVYAELREGTGTGRVAGQQVSGVPIGSVVQHFAMSHGLNFILVNVAYRQPIGRSRVAAVGRAGVGPVLPHGETEVDGQPREGYEWAGAGLQAAGGVEIAIWRGLHGLVEYKLTRARPRIEVAGGDATVTTLSHHVAVGASWMFGS